MDRPETRYAWNGNVALAYQVLGSGVPDLLYLQGYISHVDLSWESPFLSRFLRGLAQNGRLIFTDRRGWGCSDRFSPSDVTDLDVLTEDLGVVMEATGSDRAVLVASHECTLVACLFAASFPEHSSGLVLIDPWVTYARTEETPWLSTIDEWEGYLAEVQEVGPDIFMPEFPERSERERDWYMRFVRASISPGAAVAEFRRYLPADIRRVLPTIQVPSLIISDLDGDDEMSPDNARLAANLIPDTRLVELSGGHEMPRRHWYSRSEAILDEIGQFTAGIRRQEATFDRALATVLFTDIIGSTDKALELGDAGWRSLRERHHGLVRTMLSRYRGREVDTAGDGFFAAFDGPARAAYCAVAIVDAVKPLGLSIRAGLHTGEVETSGEKVGGIAVHIGARVSGLAGEGEVLATSTVKDLVAGSGLRFEDAGEHELKGIPDRWRLYRVTVEEPAP